ADIVRFETEAMPAFLEGHAIAGRAICPAAAFWEMALAAVERVAGFIPILKDAVLHEPLALDGRRIRTELQQAADGSFRVHIQSPSGGWKKHAEATLVSGEGAGGSIDLSKLRSSLPLPVPVDDLYRAWRERGAEHSVDFQSLSDLRCGEREAVGRVCLPQSLMRQPGRYRFHPVLLDGCLQVAATVLGETEAGRIWVPSGLGELNTYGDLRGPLWAHAQRSAAPDPSLAVDVYDETGRRVAEIRDLRYIAISTRSWRTELSNHCY